MDPKVLDGMAAIEQDELVKQRDFELSVTFLLPSCPVVSKNVKAKGLGVNVSSSDVTVVKSSEVTKGSTGVELSWHKTNKFKLLTKGKKVELAAWNRSIPKKDGNLKKRKADGTNAKQSKAQNELGCNGGVPDCRFDCYQCQDCIFDCWTYCGTFRSSFYW